MKNNCRAEAKAFDRFELSTYSNSELKMLGERLFIALCSDTVKRIKAGHADPSDYNFVKALDTAGEGLGMSRRQVNAVVGGFAGLMRLKIQAPRMITVLSQRELDKRVPELFREEKSIREIARELGTTKHQVVKRLKKLKLDDPNQATFPFASDYPPGLRSD